LMEWSLQQQAVVFFVAANDKKKTAEIFRPHSLIAVHSVRASGKAVGVVIRSTSIGRPLDLHVYVPAHVRTCMCMRLHVCALASARFSLALGRATHISTCEGAFALSSVWKVGRAAKLHCRTSQTAASSRTRCDSDVDSWPTRSSAQPSQQVFLSTRLTTARYLTTGLPCHKVDECISC
jgi:hypothetical protein